MDLDEATRVRLGSSASTRAETMYALAGDPSVTVRATLAMNMATPAAADAILARDPDERVRLLLARKLAALAPSLSDTARARLGEHTFETLTALAADEAVRVRAAIAEEVKHMPDAPRAVVLRLAQDTSVMVCEPVIRFSPMLSTNDLVALVTAARSPEAVRAAAQRDGLDEVVSDAIAASADTEAIRALLSNQSAQIREATLDALAERAEPHHDWHEPLVKRPTLSPRAARALASMVATHLLEALSLRDDFDPQFTNDLRRRLAARLDPAPATEITPERAKAIASELAARGGLNEAVVLEVAQRPNARLAAALLANAAGVPVELVERAASLRSAKGLVSLCWKAGFSMRAAAALQPLVARVAPDEVLHARPGGVFPLATDEMLWQIELLRRPSR